MDGTLWLNFRENMRFYRMAKGITEKQMAARMGKSVSWVSHVESGLYAQWPTPKTMQAIARVLGVQMKQLVEPLPASIIIYVDAMENAQGIENLEKIREYRKVSKRKFADQLGISRSAYSSASNGYHGFSVETWWRIAGNLTVDLAILIGRETK